MTLLPGELQPAAVVPQCLDNQYVSDSVLSEIVERKWNFRSEGIHARRRRDVHREFLRSMIYSQQVVVNRAYFVNNPFFRELIDGSDPETTDAMAELARARAFVVFQGSEPSLVPTTFDTDEAGVRAIETFLERAGDDFPIVRLYRTDDENRNASEILAQSFYSPLTGYAGLRKDRARAMLRELTRRADVTEAEVESFRQSLRQLAFFASEKAAELADDDRDFNRNEVYKRFFVRPGANVAHGEFAFQPIPFAREVKKLIDLRYNVVLPDALKRFAFAPYGFPARTALQDVLSPDDAASFDDYLASLEHLARSRVLQIQHEDMLLPELDDLSVADVVRIRALDEWKLYSKAQSRLINDPDRAVEHLPEFREKLLQFQLALHRHYDKGIHEVARRRCVSMLGVTLKFMGLVVPVIHHAAWYDYVPAAAEIAWGSLPERIKGVSVEFLVNVVDVNGTFRNMSHSYQLESIRSRNEFTRDQIREIVEQLRTDKAPRLTGSDPLAAQSRP